MPVLDSALTLIGPENLWYRGRDALELSRTSTLEEVASLLWTGTAGEANELFSRSASPRRARTFDRSFGDRFATCLMARRSEAAITISEPSLAVLRSAARTIGKLFDAAGATGAGTLAERLARGWRTRSVGDLDAALILCADHELNASSFTARCVASTDAPLSNVLLAALCALEGRRHGGAASEGVRELLREADRTGARRACRDTLSRSGWLPGFGQAASSPYRHGDPRADELLARIRLRSGDSAAQVIAFGREELGVYPSVELALATLARSADLPEGAGFALFALGRSVGWVAHALEAAAEGRLIRPRARYTGPAPVPVTPDPRTTVLDRDPAG